MGRSASGAAAIMCDTTGIRTPNSLFEGLITLAKGSGVAKLFQNLNSPDQLKLETELLQESL
jgi:hypothetical protein